MPLGRPISLKIIRVFFRKNIFHMFVISTLPNATKLASRASPGPCVFQTQGGFDSCLTSNAGDYDALHWSQTWKTLSCQRLTMPVPNIGTQSSPQSADAVSQPLPKHCHVSTHSIKNMFFEMLIFIGRCCLKMLYHKFTWLLFCSFVISLRNSSWPLSFLYHIVSSYAIVKIRNDIFHPAAWP